MSNERVRLRPGRNAPAIALYESAGWHVTDRLIHNTDDHGVDDDEHVLVKILG